MSEPRRVLFIGFWKEAWQDIIAFLEEKDFQDKAMLDHMKEVMEGKESK